ncbi:pentaheme c-type cytochrome TorC [Vibrio splendidus]|uniref:pentaheme c-type cytochrome TorC n=1 Tax=Vibrio splendidus TaxID=29497 RepID=UPI000D390570|nr:pentaheme c-type cytochrome TorC [Vibrio splendidus]PTO74428.1 pentaheme c-type cytochrome TorC [Vibrio splendidus]PTP78161.1 pentaheme c-type cytochrome TorC [Vibrio splendidus]
MKSFLVKLWRTMTRPAVHISLGVLTMGGFIAGVIFWGGFNTALEHTNTEEFCVSCHTMRDNVYVELQETVHWKNTSGVRATCPDCHVPHEWTAKIARKMQASKEVFAQVFGDLDTPEKFEARRIELAKHEWDRFSSNKSLECKNCHNYDSMDFENMRPTARIQMKNAAERDQSCVDCHKGIAHNLPLDMASASGIVGELENVAGSTSYASGNNVISIRHLPMYTDETAEVEAGLLSPASQVAVIEEKGDMIKIQIDGWRKAKGFGRVIQEDFGMNISTAILTKEVSQSDVITIGDKKEDELTGLPWEEVNLALWMKKESMVDNFDPIWNAAGQAYQSNCSTCHSQPDEAHFSANGWVGMLDGMIAFVNFDTDTEALVLKYLQKHSSDFSEGHH